jgi:acetyl esterase
MPVLPEIQPLLALVNDPNRPPTADQTPEELRAAYKLFASFAGPPPELHSITDDTFVGPGGQIGVRIYRPGSGVLPVLVWIHGGGWVIGDLDTDHTRCAQLAKQAGVVVVSVDYRLAPEHPFPAAYDDTIAAVNWVAENADSLGINRHAIALGGDSAGGNLTAAAAQGLRDTGSSPIAFQLLVYPAVDNRGDYPSMRENATGYYLTKDGMDWFERHYSPSVDPSDARRNPLLGNLDGLPPAHVMTCEFDPLRDEGGAYAAALKAAGVATTHTNFPGMIHASFGMEAFWPSTQAMMDDAVAALQRGLRATGSVAS